MQKHQAFEAELSANQSRIDALQKSGQELLDGKHYASSEVASRMEEVSSQWKKLLEATELKGTGCGKARIDCTLPRICSHKLIVSNWVIIET